MLGVVERLVGARDHVVAGLDAAEFGDADRERDGEGAFAVAEEALRGGMSDFFGDGERAFESRLGREH